ncbi:unnamed protein product, partial [Timema podura]|nr:unnamed protein product [Timema podura]
MFSLGDFALEHGYGKGPMDGVGRSLKRHVDQYVIHGHDIMCARDLTEAFQEHSSIVVQEILSSEFE